MSQIAIIIQNFPPLAAAAGVATYCAVKRVNPLTLNGDVRMAAFMVGFVGMMGGGIIGHAVAGEPVSKRPPAVIMQNNNSLSPQ